jgi:CDP-6-deoxy-D-xylo-4-hexulose-3-dehydrase
MTPKAQGLSALRQEIEILVNRYAAEGFPGHPIAPGQTIPPSGKVIGAPELVNMVNAALDGWLTTGRFNAEFEKKLAEFLGIRFVLTTNSGSSANLLAFTALTSPLLKDRAIRPGDEVITVAAGFPTTVNPIIQNGAVPVFVDIHIPTYNIDPDHLEAAVSPKTKAVMLAHTLGNPFNLDVVTDFCRRHGLWLIEDCCDALGSTYNGKKVGTFGDIGTLSFYPAHHITTGEGGAVFTSSPVLKRALLAIRDWGRDCFCEPGQDNSCGKRFDWQLGDLPFGYDHKYIYSHLGYNLKLSDMQAACGLAQMDRLDGFIASRRRNFAVLSTALLENNATQTLVLPEASPNSDPSWFGYPITIQPNSGVSRRELLQHLDRQKIGTRLLFGGNLLKQPYMIGRHYRVSGSLTATDTVMDHTFWVGIYPGISEAALIHLADQIHAGILAQKSA